MIRWNQQINNKNAMENDVGTKGLDKNDLQHFILLV